MYVYIREGGYCTRKGGGANLHFTPGVRGREEQWGRAHRKETKIFEKKCVTNTEELKNWVPRLVPHNF